MIHIKNGKLYTMTGEVIEKGNILIEHSKIVAIGETVEVPKDAEVVKVGDIVKVKVLDVDLHRNRISLSMKGLNLNTK